MNNYEMAVLENLWQKNNRTPKEEREFNTLFSKYQKELDKEQERSRRSCIDMESEDAYQ